MSGMWRFARQDYLGGEGELQDSDIAVLGEGGEGELDVGAGGVAAGVEDAGRRVRPLPGEGDLAVLGVERHAEAHEVVDAVGGLGGGNSRGLGGEEGGVQPGDPGADDDVVVALHGPKAAAKQLRASLPVSGLPPG